MSAEHPPLPAGLEQLLRMALVDPQLRAVLLGEDRDAALSAARARGLALGPAAVAVLRSIPPGQLRLSLEQLQRVTDAQERPSDAVPDAAPAGILPDVPEPVWAPQGIRPDVPRPPVSRGIDPDVPEERPRGWWRRLFGK